MQDKSAQELSLEQAVISGGKRKQVLESSYDIKNDFLRQSQAVEKLGCSPMNSLIREYKERIGSRWYIRKSLIPEIKEQLERGRIAGVPENMINIEEAVEKSGLPKSFIIKNAEFTKYGVTRYLNEETLPHLKKLHENKHLIGVPENMISLREAVQQTKVPLYFLLERAKTKKIKRHLFVYQEEIRHIQEEYRHKSRRPRAPEIKGMFPLAKAAKVAGCSPGNQSLKAIAKMIQGYWYVPNDKLRIFKKERLQPKYEKLEKQRVAEYEAQKQTLFDRVNDLSAELAGLKDPEAVKGYGLMIGEVLTLLPDVIEAQEGAYRSAIATLEKKIIVLKSQFGEKPSESTAHGLKTLINRRMGDLERKLKSEDKQFREDTINQFEYQFRRIKTELHQTLGEVLIEAKEKMDLTGDYYQGKHFEDLAHEYKYMHRYLHKIQLFSRGNFPLMKALRWIIGKEPKDSQLKAIESLFFVINTIDFYASDLGYENIDAFKDALIYCDGKDRQQITQVINNYGLAKQTMNDFSVMLMVKKLITDLDEIPMPEEFNND